MSFMLNVTFRGLCALIPDQPLSFEGDQVISGMTVLLPDARQTQQRDTLSICAHEPKVTFDQSTGPDITWDLDRERIELVDDSSAGGLRIGKSASNVPRIAEAVPGAGPVKSALMTQPGSGNLLVASLPLTSGTVHGIEPSPLMIEFREPEGLPGMYRNHFARAVQVLIQIQGDQLTLRATPFGGGSAREATLRPKPGRSSVDMTFSNLCHPSEETHGLEADADFRIYYDLLEDFFGPFLLPTPMTGQDLHGQHSGEVRGEATNSGFGCFPTFVDR